MTAPEGTPRTHRTLSDVYAERPLSTAQVRRIVALLHLTDKPARRAEEQRPEAA
ncbi:hypothetical protein [Streptomyces sp. NPDC058086]|uniref:hypothetical protein n=1 Tax=Streptomyces sp. NPDC058086 TaxID=3346334 RepID=UPI0036E3B06E